MDNNRTDLALAIAGEARTIWHLSIAEEKILREIWGDDDPRVVAAEQRIRDAHDRLEDALAYAKNLLESSDRA